MRWDGEEANLSVRAPRVAACDSAGCVAGPSAPSANAAIHTSIAVSEPASKDHPHARVF
jgi:hypothetical protein